MKNSKTKKIVFIIPPSLDMGEVALKMRVQNATIPCGVLSIISYVQAKALQRPEFRILDMNVPPYSHLPFSESLPMAARHAASWEPDVIGLSVMYNHMYKYVAELSRRLRSESPCAVIVAGGCCIMAYYDRILEDCPELDAICFAEGEIPMVDLINAALPPDEFLDSHPAWLTSRSRAVGKTGQPRFVENLDDIPPINFDILDLSKYASYRTSFRPIKKDNELCLPITTTRGCPFNCVFCIADSLHGKKVRKMSAARVISDVKEMISIYGMNVLSIEDDQFLSDRSRTTSMLEGLSELDISLIADSGFTVSLLDDQTAQLLKQAGLQAAILAIESGSEYVLRKIIDKPIRLDQVPGAVRSIRKSGMYCHAFLVTGFPGETDAHRRESIEFIKKVGIDWSYVGCATPIRGSRLYEICIDNKYIDENMHTENAYYVSCINTPDYSAEHVTRAAYMMNLELNFVYNYRLRIGDYRILAIYMDHVLLKYPGHAFARYYASLAYRGLQDEKTADLHLEHFHRILLESAEWLEYARLFGLVPTKLKGNEATILDG